MLVDRQGLELYRGQGKVVVKIDEKVDVLVVDGGAP